MVALQPGLPLWSWLFDTSFPPRGLGWPPGLSTAAQVVELTNAAACAAIAGALLFLYRARRRNPDGPRWVLALFIAFVAAGSLLHLINFLQFYWPAERLFITLASLASAVRLVSAVLLPAAIAQWSRRPTVEEQARDYIEKLSLREALARERETNKVQADQLEYLKRIESMMRGSAELARQTVDAAKATAVEKPGGGGGE